MTKDGDAQGPSRISRPDRRRFLRNSSAAAVGVGMLGVRAHAAEPVPEPPSIKRYVKLGKTGLEVSDIGFGSGGCKTPDLVRHCYDRGINYFDTAEMYKGGKPVKYVESMIGEALRDKRDKVVITTKFKTKPRHRWGKIMRELEQSLTRLQTDYVDIFMNHAVDDVARLESEGWQEFVLRAKRQGKIRFAGMSGHGGKLQECIEYALDHELADVILASHSFGSDPTFYDKTVAKFFDHIANQQGLPKVLAKAKAKGVGVVVMKTLNGAKLNDLSPYRKDGASFSEAAFRWVFSDPNVDSLIVSMIDPERADSYIRSSGQTRMRRADAERLRQYVYANTQQHCRAGCSSCESSCPAGVPVSDVLRQRMYAVRYGNRELADAGYAHLGAGAAPCLTCAVESCVDACPFELDVAGMTRETAGLLG